MFGLRVPQIQLSTVAILGFQFRLYRAIAPLSFLCSISLASLFAILSIFGWSDLLQILRKQAAFSFAVLCIMFKIIVAKHSFSSLWVLYVISKSWQDKGCVRLIFGWVLSDWLHWIYAKEPLRSGE